MMEDQKYYNNQEVPGYPLAPATVVPRSDEVSAPPIYHLHQSEQQQQQRLQRRRRIQCLAITIAFVIIQSIVVVLLLFITRVTTPSADLANVILTPGEGLRLTAQARVRNTNFGKFKFDDATITVRSSGNEDVSRFVIPESRVKARSTKKISVLVDLGSDPDSDSESGPGMANIRVEGKLKGEVEVLNVIRKKKTAELDCRVRVHMPTHEVRDLRCK